MAYLGFGLRQSCSWSVAFADDDVDVIVVAAGVAVAGVADDVVVIFGSAGAAFVDDVFGCGDVLFRFRCLASKSVQSGFQIFLLPISRQPDSISISGDSSTVCSFSSSARVLWWTSILLSCRLLMDEVRVLTSSWTASIMSEGHFSAATIVLIMSSRWDDVISWIRPNDSANFRCWSEVVFSKTFLTSSRVKSNAGDCVITAV